jgi:hypothetical protein
MDAPQRGALMLVRFVAATLICLSLLEESLYWIESVARHHPVGIFHFALLAVPLALGIVILIKASAIAGWVSDKFGE